MTAKEKAIELIENFKFVYMYVEDLETAKALSKQLSIVHILESIKYMKQIGLDREDYDPLKDVLYELRLI